MNKLFLVALVAPFAISACSPEDLATGPGSTEPDDDGLRSPPTTVGHFPEGPEFPFVGDEYHYRAQFDRRRLDGTPAEDPIVGTSRVRVESRGPFSIWNDAFLVSRVDSLISVDSTATWYLRHVHADTAAEITVPGRYDPLRGGREEFSPNRPLIRFPLLEEGDSLGTWIEGQTTVTRRNRGRHDITVAYDVEGVRAPSMGGEIDTFYTISGTVEAYLLEDVIVSPSATAVESTWIGEPGVLRSSLTAHSATQTTQTTRRLIRFVAEVD